MNLLDESFPDDQAELLSEWRIPFRRIGHDVSDFGVKDQEILPVLHELRRVTFFTQDGDFLDPVFCHPAYCLVRLDVRADDIALFLKRFLRHPRFNMEIKRMGVVARVHHDGISFWEQGNRKLQQASWRTPFRK